MRRGIRAKTIIIAQTRFFLHVTIFVVESNRVAREWEGIFSVDIERQRFEMSTRSKSILDGFRANTKDQLDNLKH